MSVYVMSWVFKNSPTQGGDRLVLLAMADKANDDGTGVFQSVGTFDAKTGEGSGIARDARLSERTVQYCVKALQLGGAIERTGTMPDGRAIYRVLMDDRARAYQQPPRKLLSQLMRRMGAQEATQDGGATVAPPNACSPEQTNEAGGANVAPPAGATVAPPEPSQIAPPGATGDAPGVQSTTEIVSQIAPKPSVNHPGTIQPHPSAGAGAPEGAQGEGGQLIRLDPNAKGLSPKTRARLERTQQRLNPDDPAGGW